MVMDLYSRRIVGWVMDKRMKKQFVINALSMAFRHKKSPAGLLHHSDRGSEYACHDYQKLLSIWHIVPGMSRKGDCWNNAPTERFFRSLKPSGWTIGGFQQDQRLSQNRILNYISCYNAIRLHSILGYKSPMDYEKELFPFLLDHYILYR